MEKLTLNAPAKINLGLNIVSKRNDGFHNLETFFYPIKNLHDTIVFEKSEKFIFDSNNSDLISDPNNLILKAHSLIEETINRKLPIKITLIKKIPIGAGLGGGSSDAATTLVGLNNFFELNIKSEKLYELALLLGSDVPFFINAKPAIGFSRGEILHESTNYIQNPIVIVNPEIHISTKEAFSHIIPKESNFDYNYFINTDNINYNFLSENLNNDFEKYVFSAFPEIAQIKELLEKAGAIYSAMSGTGSTVYGIFDDLEKALSVTNLLPKDYFIHVSK